VTFGILLNLVDHASTTRLAGAGQRNFFTQLFTLLLDDRIRAYEYLD